MKLSANRRKNILLGLGVAAMLLLLIGLVYYLCRPNLDAIAQELRAIREDPNLTPEQKLEKSREIYEKLTEDQRRQVFQNDFRKWHHERNAEMQRFLKMSPEEQKAYVKQRDKEQKRAGPVVVKGNFATKEKGKAIAKGGSGSGGGFIFYGPGGGPTNPDQFQKSMLDHFSPETRAGSSYQRGLPP